MVHIFRSLFCIAVLLISAMPGWAQSIDVTHYYRLSTLFRGSDMALDVYNGGAKNNMTHLTRTQNVSGQYWRFLPAGKGYYKLSTLFRGKNMCLDIFNGGAKNNQIHLTQCANYSGQFWKVQFVRKWVRLKTLFRGDQMCLDIFNGGSDNNQPHLTQCANYSGQFWRLSKVNKKINLDADDLNIVETPPQPQEQRARKKKKRYFRTGSCAYWKDQWKQSGSRGAYRKMSDACRRKAVRKAVRKTVRKKCGRKAYRTASGKCRCAKNYVLRKGRCRWKVDKKGFEVAPWKKPGCKTWLRQCNSGNNAACRKHETTCQVN